MSRKHLIVFLLGIISLSAVAIAQEDPFQPNTAREAPPSDPATAAALPFPRKSPSPVDEDVIPGTLSLTFDGFISNTQRDGILTRETRDLLTKFAGAADSAMEEEVAEKLKQTVTEHFEIKQRIREGQLEELETRVKRLRELHDRRTAAKTTIIDKRIELLLDEAKGVGWDVSSDRNRERGTTSPFPISAPPISAPR